MKKRLLGSLFSGLMLCFAAQSAVWAEAAYINDPKSGDPTSVTWELSSDGETLTIDGTGDMPDFPDGKDPGQPWGEDAKSTIKSVTIEDGVTGIGQNAFFNHTKLDSADIANSVTSIGRNAFASCSELTSIEVPCKAQIANGAFDSGLTPTLTHEPLADVEETSATCTSPKIAAHKKCSCGEQLFATAGTLESLGKETTGRTEYEVTSQADGENEITTNYYEVTESELEKGKPLAYHLNLVAAQDATCTSKGVKEHYVCTKCGKKFKLSTEITEEKPSSTSKHLCVCGGVVYECDEITDVETDCVPHTYSDLIKKVPATCVDEGSEAHYECTVCGKKFVLATNDKGEPIYQEASDASLIIPATGHSYSEWATTDATTTSEGEKTRYCSNCGDVETSKLSKLAEEGTSGSVSLTPTTYGYAVDTGDFISGEMFAYAYGLCACGVVFVGLRKKKSKV